MIDEYPTYKVEGRALGFEVTLTVDSDLASIRTRLEQLRHEVETDRPELINEADRLLEHLDLGRRFFIDFLEFDPWDDQSAGWMAMGGWGMAQELEALKLMLALRRDTDELAFMERWFRLEQQDDGTMIRFPMCYVEFLGRQLRRMHSQTRLRAIVLCFKRPRLHRSPLLVRLLTG